MIAEAAVATRLGLASAEVAPRLEGLLGRLGVPTSVPKATVNLDLARRALRADKKIVRGDLTLPVVPAIGSVELTTAVSVDALVGEMEGLVHGTARGEE